MRTRALARVPLGAQLRDLEPQRRHLVLERGDAVEQARTAVERLIDGERLRLRPDFGLGHGEVGLAAVAEQVDEAVIFLPGAATDPPSVAAVDQRLEDLLDLPPRADRRHSRGAGLEL